MIADKWTMIDDSLHCLSLPQQMGVGYFGSKQREHDMKLLGEMLDNDPAFRKRFGEIMERLIWGDE